MSISPTPDHCGGVWGNVEVTKDGTPGDVTSGGSRGGITEIDYWAEYNRAVGPPDLKLGVIRWTYSQKNTGSLGPLAPGDPPELTNNGPDINSTELYGALTPLTSTRAFSAGYL